MNCGTCGRLICPLGNSPQVVFCRYYESMDIMARTMQDTPPNEAKIRGLV